MRAAFLFASFDFSSRTAHIAFTAQFEHVPLFDISSPNTTQNKSFSNSKFRFLFLTLFCESFCCVVLPSVTSTKFFNWISIRQRKMIATSNRIVLLTVSLSCDVVKCVRERLCVDRTIAHCFDLSASPNVHCVQFFLCLFIFGCHRAHFFRSALVQFKVHLSRTGISATRIRIHDSPFLLSFDNFSWNFALKKNCALAISGTNCRHCRAKCESDNDYKTEQNNGNRNREEDRNNDQKEKNRWKQKVNKLSEV